MLSGENNAMNKVARYEKENPWNSASFKPDTSPGRYKCVSVKHNVVVLQ